jgi:quinol monooxygenase YgiN
MVTLFIRHRVADYAKWKPVYDEYDRKGDGITRASVHRDVDDPDVVVVTETFPDTNLARKHASTETLRSAMERAGVQGPPEFWFVEDVEETHY